MILAKGQKKNRGSRDSSLFMQMGQERFGEGQEMEVEILAFEERMFQEIEAV